MSGNVKDDAAERRIRNLAECACARQTVQSPAFVVNDVAAVMRVLWTEATEAERKRGLAIYEKAFEQNWVVQDTIDAIRGGKR